MVKCSHCTNKAISRNSLCVTHIYTIRMQFLASFYKKLYGRMIQLISESFDPDEFIEQGEYVQNTYIEWVHAHQFEYWEKTALDDLLHDSALKKQFLHYTQKNHTVLDRFMIVKDELRHY